MRSFKKVYLATSCLLSAALIALTLVAKPNNVQESSSMLQGAAGISMPENSKLINASLHLATVPSEVVQDAMGTLQPDIATLERTLRPELPPVETLTLTPPDPSRGSNKTIVSVRFLQVRSHKLGSQIPITLGNQSVVLARSISDPQAFSTRVDFDWTAFAIEQQRRKEAAGKGALVSIYEGRRFIRKEPMQFVDPEEIKGALETHQPIQFSPQILTGSPTTVVADHELMIINTSVVEDVTGGRTFDQCLPVNQQGSTSGAWTFSTLMMAIANTNNPQVAEAMLHNMLNTWNNDQLIINTFPVHARGSMGQLASPGLTPSGLLGNWPVDPLNPTLPSLAKAPIRLNAIVNRIDLGQNFNPATAGELRFIFGVTAGTSPGGGPCQAGNNGPLFNIILEYNVPSSISPTAWARAWDGLKNLNFDDNSGDFMDQLQTQITNQVVLANSCGTGVSCLAQLRTNEVELSPGGATALVWEQREFHLSHDQQGNVQMQPATVAMTPDGSFNFGLPACGSGNGMPACQTAGTVANYVNNPTINSQIRASGGALPNVPLGWPIPADPFRGGSAFNGTPGVGNANGFWIDFNSSNQDISPETARIDFSANTCNGCHGAETATFGFQHVVNRQINNAVTFSDFLVGCTVAGTDTCTSRSGQCPLNSACQETVPDPNNAFPTTTTTFGDIARRVGILGGLAGTGSKSGGLLLPLIAQRVGVH
jgi:hypothetical protein